MTSKEMEARSGVARANIRYYEAEGLLTPARLKNGYRDYSEEDLAVLEKIKLLRRLGVPIEELKALRSGSADLGTVLDRRLAELGGERAAQARVEQVCGDLRRSGETFDTLDAARYLSDLDAPALPASGDGTWWSQTPAAPLPPSDALPPAPGLTRRFFARCFDWLLTLYLLMAACCFLGKNPSLLFNAWLSIGLQVLLLLVEPLLICRLGATPGKALLGMHLSRPGGGRLSYGEAFQRHLMMLWGAVGLGIPIWSLVQVYRTVKRAMNEEPQPWDEEVTYSAAPFRPRRHLAGLALAVAVLLLAGEAVNSYSQLPPNRGDLTVAEFAGNFNRQAEYMGLDLNFYLDETGQSRKIPDPPNTVSISIGEDWAEDSGFQYTVENGRLTAVTMTRSVENIQAAWVTIPTEVLSIAVISFLWAQEDVPFWSFGREPFMTELAEADWGKGFTLQSSGVRVTMETESRNVYVSNDLGFVIPQEGQTNHFFAFTFTVALDE